MFVIVSLHMRLGVVQSKKFILLLILIRYRDFDAGATESGALSASAVEQQLVASGASTQVLTASPQATAGSSRVSLSQSKRHRESGDSGRDVDNRERERKRRAEEPKSYQQKERERSHHRHQRERQHHQEEREHKRREQKRRQSPTPAPADADGEVESDMDVDSNPDDDDDSDSDSSSSSSSSTNMEVDREREREHERSSSKGSSTKRRRLEMSRDEISGVQLKQSSSSSTARPSRWGEDPALSGSAAAIDIVKSPQIPSILLATTGETREQFPSAASHSPLRSASSDGGSSHHSRNSKPSDPRRGIKQQGPLVASASSSSEDSRALQARSQSEQQSAVAASADSGAGSSSQSQAGAGSSINSEMLRTILNSLLTNSRNAVSGGPPVPPTPGTAGPQIPAGPMGYGGLPNAPTGPAVGGSPQFPPAHHFPSDFDYRSAPFAPPPGPGVGIPPPAGAAGFPPPAYAYGSEQHRPQGRPWDAHGGSGRRDQDSFQDRDRGTGRYGRSDRNWR